MSVQINFSTPASCWCLAAAQVFL